MAILIRLDARNILLILTGIAITVILQSFLLHFYLNFTNPNGRLRLRCFPEGEITKVMNLDNGNDYADCEPTGRCSCPYFELPPGNYEIEVQVRTQSFLSGLDQSELGALPDYVIQSEYVTLSQNTTVEQRRDTEATLDKEEYFLRDEAESKAG